MILYVDDEPINLKLFVMMFRGKYKITTASSGSEALNALDKNNNIKLVVTDMKMPGMNGIELVLEAKKKYDIPFFLLSGYGLNEEIMEALDNKTLKGYFQKPLKRDKMEEEFKKYIGQS